MTWPSVVSMRIRRCARPWHNVSVRCVDRVSPRSAVSSRPRRSRDAEPMPARPPPSRGPTASATSDILGRPRITLRACELGRESSDRSVARGQRRGPPAYTLLLRSSRCVWVVLLSKSVRGVGWDLITSVRRKMLALGKLTRFTVMQDVVGY